jgi:outer membrane protein OmpA-like peptidoglycan-associated protein
MKKIYTLIFFLLMTQFLVFGQTIEKKWGLGMGAGAYYNLASTEMGLMPEAYLSRFLSPSFDIMADASIGYFGNEGSDIPLDLANVSLNLRYKFYNGRIMPIESNIQPYLKAGLGYIFDNNKDGLNFNAAAGVKFPVNKTFSFFAEAGYIHGIDATRQGLEVHDNFLKAVVGIEISFLRQRDRDRDGVIDLLDKCPDTPRGAIVDSDGCPSDSDGDGVYDGIDQCPDTPKGAPVDKEGCPLDSDNDRVIDFYDQCPDTPKGVEVNTNGCPLDSDDDGVPDYLDKCADTPSGTQVDEHGCPVDKDSDGDGVMDSVDKCPDTPKGAVVDVSGCIDYSATIDFINPTLKPVYFDTDVHDVTSNQFSKIDNLVKILNEYPEFKINLYGHADPRGPAWYNKSLSQRRVDSVVELLKEWGIDDERITTRAFGEDLVPDGELTEEQLQEERKTATYMYITIEE